MAKAINTPTVQDLGANGDTTTMEPVQSNDNINIPGIFGAGELPPKEPVQKEQSTGYDPTGIGSVIAPPKSALGKAQKVFRLANTKRKGKVHIDGQDEVINPATGKMEGIRLLRNVPSIWMRDQEKIPEAYIMKNKMSLIFEDRTMRVPEYDTKTLEFISLCRHYIDNPNRRTGSKHEFFEWNPQKQEAEKLKLEQLEIEAIIKANSVPEEQMRKHALYLGVDFSDELGEIKTPAGIRTDYLRKAKADPKKFMATIDSEIVNISYAVKSAIRDSRIDFGKVKDHAHWSAGGLICRIPMNKNTADYLIELAMTNTDEGRDFKQRVLMLANK